MQKYTITMISKVFPPKGKQTFETLGFQVAEYPNRFVTIPHDDKTKTWKQGDSVELIIDEVESNGKKYLNAKFPNEKAVLQEKVKELELKTANPDPLIFKDPMFELINSINNNLEKEIKILVAIYNLLKTENINNQIKDDVKQDLPF